MAVYKIFPDKDTTLFSKWPSLNSGMDEVLELGKQTNDVDPTHSSISRILLKFNDNKINSIYSNYIGNYSHSAYLKVFSTELNEIPIDVNIEGYPIGESWENGIGRKAVTYSSIVGSTWLYRDNDSTSWTTSSYGSGLTGSYIAGNNGGGTYYYSYKTTQSFGIYDDKDLNLNVTNIINAYNSGSIVNHGILLKLTGSLEYNTSSYFSLKYFSKDTHTIYSPHLELKWDDSIYNATSSILTNNNFYISIKNNKQEYYSDEISKIIIKPREKYPTRIFSTSSLNLQEKYLPSSSYWAVKDWDTNEWVINFDENYTKISSDTGSKSNYFKIYMDGLEPQRYYKVVVKTIIDGEEIIIEDNNWFKIND